ncbi:MAG: histidine kinase dimerization/phospho-acceptor domain-containing protein [Candidatus Sulfotelmatobacter sp.]|jgi:light-regulated signal transduction histidine kinase (bacteriophytochrome)
MTMATQPSSNLSAYLSHELRNALACIHQFGNILVDGLAGELTGEQREYVSIMLENASKIRSVLDSALDGVPGPLEK